MERHPLHHYSKGDRPRRPGGLPRQLDRDAARRTRLLHCLPHVTKLFAFGEPPMAFRSDDEFRPFSRHTRQRIQKPLVKIPFPVCYIHDERVRTALLDLARQLIPFQPAGTLLLRDRLSFALLSYWLLWSLPHLQPQDPQVHALKG
jgi:hypothetical protein